MHGKDKESKGARLSYQLYFACQGSGTSSGQTLDLHSFWSWELQTFSDSLHGSILVSIFFSLTALH